MSIRWYIKSLQVAGYVGNKTQFEDPGILGLLKIMASINLSETGANKVTEKETSPFPSNSSNSPQKWDQRSASPEYDPKAGENRLRPAGGGYLGWYINNNLTTCRHYQSHYLGFSLRAQQLCYWICGQIWRTIRNHHGQLEEGDHWRGIYSTASSVVYQTHQRGDCLGSKETYWQNLLEWKLGV